ncbi:hypothetical protein F5X96DRAFT_656879 [Biscogniauxia mediterranea]|nr:hypothetical protein F5X96DRAFT_656879 [Biscogniauxia mediterranea]
MTIFERLIGKMWPVWDYDCIFISIFFLFQTEDAWYSPGGPLAFSCFISHIGWAMLCAIPSALRVELIAFAWRKSWTDRPYLYGSEVRTSFSSGIFCYFSSCFQCIPISLAHDDLFSHMESSEVVFVFGDRLPPRWIDTVVTVLILAFLIASFHTNLHFIIGGIPSMHLS